MKAAGSSRSAGQPPPRADARWRPQDLAMLAAAIAVALWLRLANLSRWWSIYNDYDEGAWALAAKFIAEGQVPYRDFLLVHPPLYEYVLALVFAVAGFDFVTGRLVAVFFGVASVPLAAYVASRAFGVRAGLWAAFAFAVSPIMVFAGRRVVPDAWSVFLALIAIGLALAYLRRPRPWHLLVFGGILGMLSLSKFTHVMTSAALVAGLVAARLPDASWSWPRRLFSPRVLAGALILLVPIYCLVAVGRIILGWNVKLPLIDDFYLRASDFRTLALFVAPPYLVSWVALRPRHEAASSAPVRLPWREACLVIAGAAAIALVSLGPALFLAPEAFINQTFTLQANRPGVIAPSFLHLLRYFTGFFAIESLYQAELLLFFPLAWLALRVRPVPAATRFLVAGGAAALLLVQPLGAFPRYYISLYPFMLLLVGAAFAGLSFRPRPTGLRHFAAGALAVSLLSLSLPIPHAYWGYDIANQLTDPSEDQLNRDTLEFLHTIGAEHVYATSPTLLALDPTLKSASAFDTFAYLWLLNESVDATADRIFSEGVDTVVITPWSQLWGGEFGDKSQAFNQALRSRASLVRIIGTDPVYHMEVYHVQGPGGTTLFNPLLELVETSARGTAPVGWLPIQYGNAGSTMNVSRADDGNSTYTRFTIQQSGSKADGDWVHNGIVQDVPLRDFELEMRVRTTAMTTESNETQIESGIQFRDKEGRWLIVGFGGGDAPQTFRRTQDNWTMLILPVRSGEWAEHRVNVTALWAQQGWPTPESVTAEIYMAAHHTRPGTYHFDVEYMRRP